MPTNIGFDEYDRPYVEEGADEGRIVEIGDRLAVEPIPTSPTVFSIERSVDDGDTWEQILGPTPSPDGATMFDPESLSYGDNLYRAIAQTVEGATSATTITVPARSGALWLSGGPGFALICRLPLNPQITRNGGRATTVKQYAGRTKPVTYKGEALSNVYQVAGVVTDRNAIEPNASPDELMDVVRNEEPLHLLRTPDGVRAYGAVSDVKLGRQTVGGDGDALRPWNAFWGYQFELEEATDA